MKRTISLLLIAIMAVLPSCMKMTATSTIRGDGSGEQEMSFGYKLDTIAMLRQMAEGQMGEEHEGEDPFAKIDENLFDEKKLKESMTKLGMEEVTVKVEEKDGWKNMSLKGKFKDLSAMMAKNLESEDVKKAKSSNPELGSMMDGFAAKTFAFYKTNDPNIVKISILPPIGSLFPTGDENPLEKLDDLGEDERAMIEQQMEQMRAMFALDQMKMELKMRLPGDVTEVHGAKKDEKEANVVTWSMKGADIGIDSAKTMFGMKDGIWAKFKKPADFKITLKDEPKATESKPAGGTTPKAPAKPVGEEEKKKKEDGG